MSILPVQLFMRLGDHDRLILADKIGQIQVNVSLHHSHHAFLGSGFHVFKTNLYVRAGEQNPRPGNN